MRLTALEDIVAAHRTRAARDERGVDQLLARAFRLKPTRPFAKALDRRGISVIAEIKRRSPSAGDLAIDLHPAHLAAAYESGGAACLSVVTDFDFFAGSADDLQTARGAVGIPVLRKDFTVSVNDVVDARLMGADAILLIVAVLDDEELNEFHEIASDLGLAVVVEVHTEAELDRAMNIKANAKIIGVNQRDLYTFEINREVALELAESIPGGIIRVAESGIRDRQDVQALADAGFDAALVGTSLVTSASPGDALRQLVLDDD